MGRSLVLVLIINTQDRVEATPRPCLVRGTLVAMVRINRGFTIVELMVVVTVIAILATIVYSSIGAASPKARNAERQADIRNLQTAIEQYKQKNGQYPAMGCVPGSNQISDEGDCANYIAGLAPEFITVLPKDIKRGTNPGYGYVTNTSAPNNVGTSYKVFALGTVEAEAVTSAHPMKSCDSTADICNNSCGIGATLQASSYALWGGFADGLTDAAVKTATADVICK